MQVIVSSLTIAGVGLALGYVCGEILVPVCYRLRFSDWQFYFTLILIMGGYGCWAWAWMRKQPGMFKEVEEQQKQD